MKITSVELHPEGSSEVVALSFRDPRSVNPYNVKSITGLDAETLGSRVIALKMGLNPSYRSYSSLRDVLYKMIASSRTGRIQVRFLNALEVVAAISGFIGRLEANHFEKVQEVVLTIQCEDPMLKSISRYNMAVNGLELDNVNIADDKSTAPHGFRLQLTALAAVDFLRITNPSDPSWEFKAVPVGGFQINDEIHLSCETGTKYLYLIRATVTTQLGDVIVPNSAWPVLFPGNNIFAFDDPTNLRIDAVSFYHTYWGV